jgi:hypothetical protein
MGFRPKKIVVEEPVNKSEDPKDPKDSKKVAEEKVSKDK